MIVAQSEDTATKAPVQKAKRRKKDNSQHVNKWTHSDISLPTGFKWTLPDPVLETVEPPVSLFEKFFTDDIMKFICEESIRYAISKGNHSFTIDTNTLKAFIAIFWVSGYVDMPRRPTYWKHNEDTNTTTVSSLLSRNRFDEIMQNLHLAGNSNLDKEDKSAKVRPLINKLNDQCLAKYLSEQAVSIDESMVPYLGRQGWKKYMRNKPVKFGYKSWVTEITIGYAIQFYPCTGKDENYDSNQRLATLAGKLPSQVGSSYHIIMDDFITIPNLLRILKAKGIALTGTVKINQEHSFMTDKRNGET